MISGLLSFLGLGFGVLDNPQAVADRNSHFQSLVAQVEKVWVAGSEVLNTRFNTNPLKPNLAKPTQENALA